MNAREELQRLVARLSDYESRHLLSAVQNVAEGERFWEGDVGVFYNEYVKARGFAITGNLTSVVPAGISDDEGIFAPIPIVKSYPDAARVELPSPGDTASELFQTIRRRKSRREYSGADLTIDQLSRLLYFAAGMTGAIEAYDYTRLPLRAFPSTGGLQSAELYMCVNRVDTLETGLYHYRPLDHALECIQPGDHSRAVGELALGQPWVAASAVVLMVTGYYERLRWKYGERAYRYMCMDVGCLTQNVYLVGESLGLGVCAIAGFVDDAAERLLAINGRDEMALLLLCIGVPGDPPDPAVT
jgi:SagB-type dehydrogenase family enzyme